jgi:large subunit ribosomal protein L35
MPKMKTRRSAAKRFKKTGSGAFQRRKANRRHILTKMSSKRKRQLANGAMVDPADEPRIRRQLPYL